MSKHFSVNIAVVDTSHFIDFNIPPPPKKKPYCLVFLYLFIKSGSETRETMKSRSSFFSDMKSIPLACTGWLLFFSICFKDDAYKIRSVFRIK